MILLRQLILAMGESELGLLDIRNAGTQLAMNRKISSAELSAYVDHLETAIDGLKDIRFRMTNALYRIRGIGQPEDLVNTAIVYGLVGDQARDGGLSDAMLADQMQEYAASMLRRSIYRPSDEAIVKATEIIRKTIEESRTKVIFKGDLAAPPEGLNSVLSTGLARFIEQLHEIEEGMATESAHGDVSIMDGPEP